MQVSRAILTLTNAGGVVTYNPITIPDEIIISPSGGAVTLAANYTITTLSHPGIGTKFRVYWESGINLNGNSISIFGQPLVQWQLTYPGYLEFVSINATDYIYEYVPYDLAQSSILDGDCLITDSVTLDKLQSIQRGRLIVGNSSNEPTEVNFSDDAKIPIGDGSDLNSVSITGDISIDNTGLTAISSGVIVNADVNASAAIARSKMASGTASHVIINDGSGAFSSEAQLAQSRGGTGINSSASTGFPVVSTGTWSVGSIAVDRDLDVSFESGEVGDFKLYMGFAGTLTNIYAYATKAIAGTDDATIVSKNNAGTTMGTGTITFTASDPRGTAYTVSPSTNNTFIANDILTFTTAKTTAGGTVHLSLTFTRNS